MEIDIDRSIFKTVQYSDIFDYPLTYEEIWKYLIVEKKVNRKSFEKSISSILLVSHGNGFYFLPKRGSIVAKRIKRKKESQKKIILALRVAKILSVIPSVLLLGVSGGVSMQNADKKDDIDIFVITRKNSLWTTRLILICVLKLMGKYRDRFGKKVADKFCLNMFITEDRLSFPPNSQNLYMAHEVSQMLPLFNRDKIYEKFLSKNKWVLKFMPNAFDNILYEERSIPKKDTNFLAGFFEFFAKSFQLWYIKRHITTEVVSDDILAFHPFDYSKDIMKKYNKFANHE